MRHKKLLVVVVVFVAAHGVGAASRSVSPEAFGGGAPGPSCEGGAILDDGSFETAYGWVPSAEWGEYVQTFQVGRVEPVMLDSVCVCWTRTREDDGIGFEVVIYEDLEGQPVNEPLAVIDASMNEVPAWPDGRFVEVPIGFDQSILMPGTYHIGVRWAPAVDQFFFVCVDQSNPDAAAPGFFRDDRAEGEWGSVLESSDPIFDEHTAMLIRARWQDVVATPAIGSIGAGILIVMIALGAFWYLRRG